MTERRNYTLTEVLDRLGFDYDFEHNRMDCPFCNSKRKMSLDFEENTYRCPKCGNSGGVFHIFTHFHLGYDLEKKAPKAEKAKVAKALAEFMGDETIQPVNRPARPPKTPRPKIPVADDDRLDAVYQAMSKIPALRLSEKHREDLHRRGLNDEAIDKNGYLTIPESLPVSDYYQKLYEDEGGERRRTHEISWLTAKQIRFGLMIAHRIIRMGLDVSGVPGFFKFGNFWAYWVNPGMMIPTRNIKGQIVIWQVRRDHLTKKDNLRYYTNSCKDLPGHTTSNVSRCHFPIANAPLSPEFPLLLTEGPLKADVACHLYGNPVSFVAIPGIQTTKDLYANIANLKQAGILYICNALDMDRLTNKNVRNGSRKITDYLESQGVEVMNMYWGTSYATSTLLSLLLIARHRQIPLPKDTSDSVFDRLGVVCEAMEDKVPTLYSKDANGKPLHWESETKGIDDYLLNCK